MPLKKYGVLKTLAVEKKHGFGQNPHYHIRVIDEEHEYRLSVNVKSKQHTSELRYIIIDPFHHPITDQLEKLDYGFHPIENRAGGLALDYIRGNLFDPLKMKILPHHRPGPDNDLNEKLDNYISRAITDEEAIVYAFGEPWGPENKRDREFGFFPDRGIHDIHMNQGNSERWKSDNGVWQDGGLIIDLPAYQKYIGIFLAFQSQSFHTHDQTGHAIPGPLLPIATPTKPEKTVQENPVKGLNIISAMVNPSGRDKGKETVSILNQTDQDIDLEGWAIADQLKRKTLIKNQKIKAGEVVRIQLHGATQLTNSGGIISLLNPDGLKVDGVAYTKTETKKAGWSIKF